MSLFSLMGKCVLATVGGGAVISSIALPLALRSKSSVKSIVIENLPEELKGEACQALEAEKGEKYLLVCDLEQVNSEDVEGVSRINQQSETSPVFFFLSGKNKPTIISSFEGKEKVGEKNIKVTFTTFSWLEGGRHSSGQEAILTDPSSSWVDILLEAELHKCKITKKTGKNTPWTVTCRRENEEGENIYLAPLVVK